MIWIKTYLPPLSNQTSIEHYKLIDYYADAVEDDIQMAEIHRGWGKSQWNILYGLWCVCIGREDYVLVVGGTQDLSNDLISSAGSMIEDAVIPGVSLKRFVEGILEIRRSDGSIGYLVAKSTGSKLRGVAKGPNRVRPSLIILDDIVSDDLVVNRLRMARANRWITSALLPTLSPGGRTIGSGTPLHSSDPFMTLVAAFGSHRIPLSNTSFPDRFTPEFIARKKAQYEKLGQMSDWRREMELVITSSEDRVFESEKIKFIDVDDLPEDLVFFMTVDGAFSEKETADVSAITVLGVDSNHNWYAIPYGLKAAPNKVGDKVLELAAQYNVDNVGIEKGSFKLAIGPHLEEMMPAYQVWFTIHDLNTAGSKLSRIKALSGVINTGRLTIVDVGDDSEELTDQIELTTHEGTMSCSAFDTIVHTVDGPVKMGCLNDDDRIFAFTGKSSVVSNVRDHTMTGVKRVFEVMLIDGTSLRFTATHPFLTQRGWVLLQDLLPTDSIIKDDKWKQLRNTTQNGSSMSMDTIMDPLSQTDDIYIERSMREKLVIFQKTMKSTILTSARLITNYLILKLYQLLITEQSIDSKVMSHTKLNGQETTTPADAVSHDIRIAKNVGKTSSLLQRLSTGLSSAVNTASKGLIQIPIYATKAALYVMTSSVKMLQIKNAVLQSVASRKLEESVSLSQWNIPAIANGVDPSLYQEGLQLSAAAKTVQLNEEPGCDMKSLEEAVTVRIQEVTEVSFQPVYNFEVDQYHNYLVEGGCVSHNSHDDFIDSLCQALQLDTTWYPQRKLSREDYRPRKNTKNSYN